jgi:diketogulonate reductase-like aldo/keto reductase
VRRDPKPASEAMTRMLTLESHGAKIPAIGLGTWDLRGRDGARIIEQALRLGYRHIDTAQIYDNERQVGEAMRSSGVRRGNVFVTTKVHYENFAPLELERSVKESLSKLRLSEVDLLLLHWPNPRVPIEETLGGLAKVKQAGMARHIGLSNFTVALMDEAVARCAEPLACNQIEYHAYLNQDKVLEACRRHGMVVVAYCPIARGQVKNDEAIAAIARRHGRTPAQICLRWLIQQGVGAIPRTSKVERLSENLDVFDFALSEDEMTAIAAMGSPKGRICHYAFSPAWD